MYNNLTSNLPSLGKKFESLLLILPQSITLNPNSTNQVTKNSIKQKSFEKCASGQTLLTLSHAAISCTRLENYLQNLRDPR